MTFRGPERFVIPVVVGSSPISHPTKSTTYRGTGFRFGIFDDSESITALAEPPRAQPASLRGALTLPHPSSGWSALATSLLLAPVLEELVFRGGIQDVLDRTPWGRLAVLGGVSVGNVLTSLLFSAAHLMMAPAWLAAAIFFPSLVFGRLKQLYPSLLPAMLVHAWYNACYLTAGTVWTAS